MIRFSDVNRPGNANYNPAYQRHHLIPLQVKSIFDIDSNRDTWVSNALCLDDFTRNGLLLPCREGEAFQTGWPLHRGPHPEYNSLVIDRMSNIFRLRNRVGNVKDQRDFFAFRILSLQRGLRRGLIGNKFLKLRLNKRDPFKSQQKFHDLDNKVDELWKITSTND